MRRLAPPLAAALILAACAATTATLSPDQCRNDWRATGHADGEEGAPPSKIVDYRTACARGGTILSAAEEDAWFDGWREAVERRQGGEIVVVEERSYPPEYAPAYAPAYPRVYPSVGIGVGSGGVSVGGGLAFDYGAFGLGFYF